MARIWEGLTTLAEAPNPKFNFSQVKDLDLSYCDLSDLPPLDQWTGLEKVNISHNPDLKTLPLAGMPKLAIVNCEDTAIGSQNLEAIYRQCQSQNGAIYFTPTPELPKKLQNNIQIMTACSDALRLGRCRIAQANFEVFEDIVLKLANENGKNPIPPFRLEVTGLSVGTETLLTGWMFRFLITFSQVELVMDDSVPLLLKQDLKWVCNRESLRFEDLAALFIDQSDAKLLARFEGLRVSGIF